MNKWHLSVGCLSVAAIGFFTPAAQAQSDEPATAEPLPTVAVETPEQPAEASAAAPAETAGPRVEEVIVTASRRQANLQDVNIAVTAFTTEALQDNVLKDVRDLARITPSLTVSQSSGSGINPIVALRGQVQNDVSLLTQDPSVGIYLDEIYLGRSPGSLLDFFDVERVEVLKGPQGTLYGRNTTGGAIRVIPVKADPAAGWDGFVRGGIANYGTQELEGASNIPVTDDLAFRVGLSARYRDGWGTRYITDRNSPGVIVDSTRINDKQSLSGRLGGVWKASDALRLEVGGDYTDQKTHGASSYDADGDLAVQPIPGALITGYERSSSDFYSFASDVRSLSSAKTGGIFGKGELDVSFGTIKLIEGYRRLNYEIRLDVDGTSAFGAILPTVQKTDQNSTELQLLGKLFDDRLDYVVGGYFFNESGTEDSPFTASEQVAGLPNSPGILMAFDQNPAYNKVDNVSYSVFLQTTFHFTDSFSFTGGVRPIRDSKRLYRHLIDFGFINLSPLGQGLALGGTPGCTFEPGAEGVTNDGTQCKFDLKTKYSYTAYTAGFDWKPYQDLLVYLKTSKGARSGGQQGRGGAASTLEPFDPEFVQDVELGLKGVYFDHRLQTNLAIYHTNYDNYQTTVLEGVATVVRNVASAKINGVELETLLALTDEISLSGSASYIDFKFDDEVYIAPYAPEFQGNAGISFKQPVSVGEFGATVGYAFRTKMALYPARAEVEVNDNLRQSGYGLLTASAFVKIDSADLRIGIFGANLTDKEYKVNVLPSLTQSNPANGGIISPGAPRTFGIELTKNFGS